MKWLSATEQGAVGSACRGAGCLGLQRISRTRGCSSPRQRSVLLLSSGFPGLTFGDIFVLSCDLPKRVL